MASLKPSEIQKLYPTPIKNSALRSYLKILMDKGHVSRRKVGKAYEYQAVTRHAVGIPFNSARSDRRLLRRFDPVR